MTRQILAIDNEQTAIQAAHTIANDSSLFRLPFAFREGRDRECRDAGGFVEFTGVSWDFFDRVRTGGPGRVTLHADLKEWGTRTDPSVKPELALRGRLDIEIDFAHVDQTTPKFRGFVYHAAAQEQPCVSTLQLSLARDKTAVDGSVGEWDHPLAPAQDWRAEAICKCLQASSPTLFWVLQQAGMLTDAVMAFAVAPVAAVSTLGFDVVFATTLACINRDLLRNSSRLAATFTYAAPASGVQMQGTFGPWQIVPGGSGTIADLKIPITAGVLSTKGRLGAETVDLTGFSVTIETDLTMVPSADAATQQELRFAFQAGQAAGARMATVIDVEGPADRVAQASDALKTHLPECLNANAANFAYVFATIRIAEPGATTWLAPAQCAYCFAQPQGSVETFVALLGSGAAAPIRPQDLRIDPALLGGATQPGPESGYLAVSKNMYLSKVIQPALQQMFPGTTAGSYRFDASAQKIVNTGPFALPSIPLSVGTYTPQVNVLEVTADHGALITYIQGTCDMGLNITLSFSGHTTSVLSFDIGKQSFGFVGDPHADITSSVSIPWYDYFLLALGIPGLIVAAIETAVLLGFDRALRSGNVRLAPPEDESFPLRWGGMRAFQANEAAFADSFYMRGRLQ